MDDINTILGITWLVLILGFAIVEMLTLDLTFIMLSAGCAVALISGALGLPWPLQIILAAVASLLLIFLLRPPILARLRRRGDKTLGYLESLPGTLGVAVTKLTALSGQVKLTNGELWSARVDEPTDTITVIPAGSQISVNSVHGATVKVTAIQNFQDYSVQTPEEEKAS